MKKDKSYKKLTAEGVQGLLQLRHRGGKIRAKKGKGSYSRKSKYAGTELKSSANQDTESD